MKANQRKHDTQTERIYRALKSAFPNLPEEQSEVVYEQNRYSTRVRVVDASFAELSLPQRHSVVKKALAQLDPEDRENISLLLMLSPEEAAEPDLMNLEFKDPGRSKR